MNINATNYIYHLTNFIIVELTDISAAASLFLIFKAEKILWHFECLIEYFSAFFQSVRSWTDFSDRHIDQHTLTSQWKCLLLSSEGNLPYIYLYANAVVKYNAIVKYIFFCISSAGEDPWRLCLELMTVMKQFFYMVSQLTHKQS